MMGKELGKKKGNYKIGRHEKRVGKNHETEFTGGIQNNPYKTI